MNHVEEALNEAERLNELQEGDIKTLFSDLVYAAKIRVNRKKLWDAIGFREKFCCVVLPFLAGYFYGINRVQYCDAMFSELSIIEEAIADTHNHVGERFDYIIDKLKSAHVADAREQEALEQVIREYENKASDFRNFKIAKTLEPRLMMLVPDPWNTFNLGLADFDARMATQKKRAEA